MAFPYKKVLVDSVRFVYQNKILWLLAIFISEASLFINFDIESWRSFTDAASRQELVARFSQTISSGAGIIIFWVILGLLILFFAIASLICKSGIIQAIKDANDNKKIRFWEKIKFGASKFWPMLLLEILFALPNIALIFFVVLLLLFAQLGAVLAAILSTIFILYNLFVFLFRHYCYCYLNLEDQKAAPALLSGLRLFIQNVKVTILINLIKLGLIVLFFIASVIISLIVSIPFVLFVFLTSLLSIWIIPFIIAILGLLSVFIVIFVIKGIKSSYLFTVLTHTYWLIKK